MTLLKFIAKWPRNIKKIYLVLVDIVIIILSYFLTLLFVHTDIEIQKNIFLIIILFACIAYILVLYFLRIYRNLTKYSGARDYLLIGIGCVVSCAIVLTCSCFLPTDVIYIRINVLASIFIIFMCITYRVFLREIINYVENKSNNEKKNVLIIGGGQATAQVIKNIQENMAKEYHIVGIVDDDVDKQKYSMYGIKIIGTRYDIKKICVQQNVDLILFSINNIKEKDKKKILNICNLTKVQVKVILPIEAMINGTTIEEGFRDVEVEDLLCRDTIALDNVEIGKYLANKVILVTGAGGSIGSELCRQIIKYNPSKLIILDIYENTLYDIERELENQYDKNKVITVIASVRDKKRLEDIFEQYKPEIVFHAAAHKHVPLMEDSPTEAIKNNVFGTYNVADCADKYGVNRFILISTDKAVNPTSIMGASKRICEMIIQAKNANSKTNYAAVRFGNVLGSNGSVIPIFKKQIQDGGPVTVTHKDITRYFMLIPEAVGLILQTVTYAKGGEIFVLDMGEPVKIYDLAQMLIKLSGKDVPIEITGLRTGEKLYEELLIAEEGLSKTVHPKIMVSRIESHSEIEVHNNLKMLSEVIDKDNCSKNDIVEVIKKIVPTFIENKE